MQCLYLVLTIVVIQETSELNPDILKYDDWIKDAETTVKRIKANEMKRAEYEINKDTYIHDKRETDTDLFLAQSNVTEPNSKGVIQPLDNTPSTDLPQPNLNPDPEQSSTNVENALGDGVRCETEMAPVEAGKHRLFTPFCLVYFCEIYNSTYSKLHEIECQDYIDGKIPDSFPQDATKIYRVLCRRCYENEVRIIENAAAGFADGHL